MSIIQGAYTVEKKPATSLPLPNEPTSKKLSCASTAAKLITSQEIVMQNDLKLQ